MQHLVCFSHSWSVTQVSFHVLKLFVFNLIQLKIKIKMQKQNIKTDVLEQV